MSPAQARWLRKKQNIMALPTSKVPIKIVLLWCIVIIVVYWFYLGTPTSSRYDVEVFDKRSTVDCIVLIAMGAIAQNAMVDYSISSIRQIGKWSNDIYLITDSPDCFLTAKKDNNIKIIAVPPEKSIIHIKAMKSQLFELLPAKVISLLYLDVDILVQQNMEVFLHDLTRQMLSNNILSRLPSSNTTRQIRDLSTDSHSQEEALNKLSFAAFADAKGHFVGFCSGCEKWHTGIIYLRKDNSESGNKCLEAWGKILLSGKFNTDQESLDEAEKLGFCPNTVTLPSRHLLFAKDYIGMALTARHTFVHLTATGATLHEQGYFYKSVVVPRLRNALNPPLSPDLLLVDKGHCQTLQSDTPKTASDSASSTSTTLLALPPQLSAMAATLV